MTKKEKEAIEIAIRAIQNEDDSCAIRCLNSLLKSFVKVGDRFCYCGASEFLLIEVTTNMVALVDLESGTCPNTHYEVGNPLRITKEEFFHITSGRPEDYTKI